jgi:hypothetical protein
MIRSLRIRTPAYAALKTSCREVVRLQAVRKTYLALMDSAEVSLPAYETATERKPLVSRFD